MANAVKLSSDQLKALDALIAKNKDITTPANAPAPNDCWFDCVVNAVVVVTMVAGCAGAAVAGAPHASGGEQYTLQQLKDLRANSTKA